MSFFSAESLFDLSTFRYSSIFIKGSFAWEALDNLDLYADKILGKKQSVIGKNSIIDSTAKIEGRLICGDNCAILDATLIRGVCIFGDGVRIGHGSEVKNAIIMNNSAIAHLNYVGDGVVGNNVNISGGVTLANWRFDKQSISVKNGNKKIDTGRKKFSALIGDGSNIGVNSVINPGTVLGKNCVVFPLVSVAGTHKSSTVIKK